MLKFCEHSLNFEAVVLLIVHSFQSLIIKLVVFFETHASMVEKMSDHNFKSLTT